MNLYYANKSIYPITRVSNNNGFEIQIIDIEHRKMGGQNLFIEPLPMTEIATTLSKGFSRKTLWKELMDK